LDGVRAVASDQIAWLAGHAANWVDEAGDTVGGLSESAADRLSSVSGQVADGLGRRTEWLGGQVATVARSSSARLSDGVIQLGEDLSGSRPPE
jgi:hypothetical protein